MNVIFVNIDTMRDARMSSNFDGVMSSINVLMDEGFTIQVVQEAVNMKPIKLFQINDFKEFEAWVNNGCPSQKQ